MIGIMQYYLKSGGIDMADISKEDARRIYQLQMRWHGIKMQKLQQEINDVAMEYAENFAELYAEVFGGEIIPISSESINDESYSGFRMMFLGIDPVSEQIMIEWQDIIFQKLHLMIDFKIISEDEFELFVMNN